MFYIAFLLLFHAYIFVAGILGFVIFCINCYNGDRERRKGHILQNWSNPLAARLVLVFLCSIKGLLYGLTWPISMYSIQKRWEHRIICAYDNMFQVNTPVIARKREKFDLEFPPDTLLRILYWDRKYV
jgi:hypothetical protein